MKDPTERFTDRARNYVKYRGAYPATLIEFLRTRCRLNSDARVADVGSGTGLLSKIFLENGNSVYAIEPNKEMREAAERLLGDQVRFKSIAASAESTSLEENSVEFVTAGRAFQWFDADRAIEEMSRILVPGGWAVIVSGGGQWGSSPFARAYEDFKATFCPGYEALNQRRNEDNELLRSRGFSRRSFNMSRMLDFDALKGLVLSLSLTPQEREAGYQPMLDALNAVFRQHQKNSVVPVEQVVNVHYGRSPFPIVETSKAALPETMRITEK